MRHYVLFSLKDEYVSYLIGREPLLNGLFLSFELKQENIEIVKKQVEYITKLVPFLELQSMLYKLAKRKKGFKCSLNNPNVFTYSYSEDKHYSEIEINDHFVTVKANGHYEAEAIFFEQLRKLDKCFFAVDIHHNRFGWLNPVKQQRLI